MIRPTRTQQIGLLVVLAALVAPGQAVPAPAAAAVALVAALVAGLAAVLALAGAPQVPGRQGRARARVPEAAGSGARTRTPRKTRS